MRSQCRPILTVTLFLIVTNFVYPRRKITNERSDALLCESLMLLKFEDRVKIYLNMRLPRFVVMLYFGRPHRQTQEGHKPRKRGVLLYSRLKQKCIVHSLIINRETLILPLAILHCTILKVPYK